MPNQPDPDDVNKHARAYASKAVDGFNAYMRAKYPDFWIDWKAKPTDRVEDGFADIAYDYVSELERALESPTSIVSADKHDDFEFEGYR